MLALHLETSSQIPHRSLKVPIYRADPLQVTVEKSPFLTELNVENAELKDWEGAYAIELQFDDHGTRYLEIVTVSNLGKRMAVFGGLQEPRWLAAPVIQQRLVDGRFSFFPDATREEMRQWVAALKELARKQKKKLF